MDRTSSYRFIAFHVTVITWVTIVSLLLVDGSRDLGFSLLMENGAVELLTFIFAMIASILSLYMSINIKRKDRNGLRYYLFVIIALGMFFLSMEEIAWGQHFFKFDTPEVLHGLNLQGETTFHNLRGMQGRTELLRLSMGLLLLTGWAMNFVPSWRPYAVPRSALLLIALVIGHSLVDTMNDLWPMRDPWQRIVNKLSELAELAIVQVVLLYLLVHRARGEGERPVPDR